LFLTVASCFGQDTEDYQTFGFCGGYLSKELKVAESSTSKVSVAVLQAESQWYNAKLASLPMSLLKKVNATDFGAQAYDLDVQNSGGPPTEQAWRARRHTECAEIAIELFPTEASCFKKSGQNSVFVCKSPDSPSTNLEVAGDRMPGMASPRDIQRASPSFVEGSPSSVYNEFLNLRSKWQWSKMFDMFDPDSQHRFAAEMRQALSGMAPEVARQANSMSDRDIFGTVFKTAIDMEEVRIISEHVSGDVAILDTQIRKNNTWYDADPPVELHRINGKWKMYWSK
jgi:hypothetical protein